MPGENKNSEEWPEELMPRSSGAPQNEGAFMPNIEPSKPEINQSPEIKPEQTQEPIQQPKKSHKGLIILLIVLFILIALGVGGFFAYQKYSSQISFLWKQPVDENDQIVQDMKNKAEIAQKEVRKKYSDAYLVVISVGAESEGVKGFDEGTLNLQQQFGLNMKNNYFFGFISPRYKKEITVFSNINKYENKIKKVLEYPLEKDAPKLTLEIPINEINVGYKKVLGILDENGGKKFKEQNSNVQQTLVTLTNFKDKYVAWKDKSLAWKPFVWTLTLTDRSAKRNNGFAVLSIMVDPKDYSFKILK